MANKTKEEYNLTTSLQPRHALVNYAELPVLCAAFSPARQQLLVADHRTLRLYAGTQLVAQQTLPATLHNSPVQTLHHNAMADFFIIVHTGIEARICTLPALEVLDEAKVDTKQNTILSSCWLEARQELVTSGSDGSIRWFATAKHYTNTSKGRKLVSKLVPRMSVKSDLKWVKVCAAPHTGSARMRGVLSAASWVMTTSERHLLRASLCGASCGGGGDGDGDGGPACNRLRC